MFKALREFHIGRPQIFAGLLLFLFAAQCVWVSAGRRFSDLEYEYMASGNRAIPGQEFRITSPMTAVVAAAPLRIAAAIRGVAPASVKSALAIPPIWWVRLPFVIFGVWLGGALWWVARRLYGNEGGYVALALYCCSPAMIKISSNIGPEIILAWSGFGLIYTAIGVAHTLYAPPRKWAPRIVLLGIAMGLCMATMFWAGTLVLLALAFMLYLTPGCRDRVVIVMGGASLITVAVLIFFRWLTGSFGLGSAALFSPWPTLELVRGLFFVFSDDYFLPVIFAAALAVYVLWPRARYFGNTAPLLAGFAVVALFALVPGIYLWRATLGLSFCFVFVGGVVADALETPARQRLGWGLTAALLIKSTFSLIFLIAWTHQN
ncbi:MAG: glycosyltransferase family 39 protein [Acidobacteriia bacterium]|nr:glycosyltransferase family 39 protein [Terriglobia bacterium]